MRAPRFTVRRMMVIVAVVAVIFGGVRLWRRVNVYREKAQQHLDEVLKKCCCDGLDLTSMVTVGLPFQEIAAVARDLAADLIVMGGYGRSGRGPIEKVFFGSTAEKVVRLLPCPVLCVPWENRAVKEENPL